ncbi:MAG: type II secretion system F family protein [Candidatus Vogelbacteria bacterium]|nr:type II secretion system F family protein [Candidatus Vogelbacteria bacterium]
MKFKYKAHKPGEEVFIQGEIEAGDKFHLSRQMRDQGLILIAAIPVSNKWFDFSKINELVVTVKLHDLVTFVNNLSAMLSAGLSLSRSLDVLGRQTRNIKFKRVIGELVKSIAEGKSLSVSMFGYPKIFSPVLVAMVAAGEESGNLPQSLKTVGDQMEKTYMLRRKIKGAMTYPGVILTAMLAIGFLMLTFVVPTLVSTFKEFNVQLPLSTRVIIGLSEILSNYWGVFLVSLTITAAVIYRILITIKGRRFIDFLLLHLPFVSGIVKEVNSATMARTLSSLIGTGVNMVESLDITARVLQNSYYKNVVILARDGVQKGDSLSGFFQKEENLFPILVGELTEVGEETGKLPEMLANVATFFENEVEAVTKDMSTIIEPILMIIIGLFVGFFAISIIQPIYSITEAI